MAVYDSLMKKGESYLHLCHIKGGSCLKADINPCCFKDGVSIRCDLFGPGGCTIKALKCKLFFCGKVRTEHPKLTAELNALSAEADKKLPGLKFYQSREEYEKIARG